MKEIKQIFVPTAEIMRLCEVDEFIKNILAFFDTPQFEVAANTENADYIKGAMWGISMATTMANINTPNYLAVKED